ncbi:unnamed protein product [Ilex paraguariensis]|uniref:Uncharacterized protein n=1 Tax=Ilex paraguariensis TaxID=185542 RepID=A0ABC8SU89_9AQUA
MVSFIQCASYINVYNFFQIWFSVAISDCPMDYGSAGSVFCWNFSCTCGGPSRRSCCVRFNILIGRHGITFPGLSSSFFLREADSSYSWFSASGAWLEDWFMRLFPALISLLLPDVAALPLQLW